jgi:tetratricopeptide (TPR) repeat protein
MGRRLGLIIGVNSYQDTNFQPLHYAENDARAIAQWLVNTKGGNWSPPDVQHVQGAYATHELIESLITRLCRDAAGPGDLVFVYFAGHAFVDQNSGEGFLALANTNAQQPATAIHLATLAQQCMQPSRAAHIIFLLDCFQNGRAWNRRRSTPFDAQPLLGPRILNGLQQTSDRFIICSCRGNESAPEASEKNLGLFTYRMILGLCGPASDPTTKQITLQKLHAFLSRALGEQQRPQLFGQERTPLVLVGDTSTPVSPVPTQPSTPAASMPPTQTGQRSTAQNASFAQVQTGTLAPAFQQSSPTTPFAQPATTTGQLSPNTSGQLMLSETEQQIAMLLRQARHLIQMQNPAEAFNVVEQVLHITPSNVSALILKAQLLGSVGRFEEALYIVDLVLQLDANNALVWSLRAALFTNTGQYQSALQSVERSLELDPNNTETYSIKTSIMERIASATHQGNKRGTKVKQPSGGPASFFRSAGVHVLGLLVGIAGVVLPIFQPHLPIQIALVLQSVGLALLCVNAVRGSYLYGFFRFFFTLIMSGLTISLLGAAALIGGVNKIGQGRIYTMVQNNPNLLLPLLLCGIWFAAAAALPLLLAFFALIVGLITGVRRKP